jgi:hypothetical protein
LQEKAACKYALLTRQLINRMASLSIKIYAVDPLSFDRINQKEIYMYKDPTQEETQKINAEFKKAFPKLTDSDLVLYKSNSTREKFIEIIVDKQGIDNATAAKRLKEIEASCGCGSSTKAA